MWEAGSGSLDCLAVAGAMVIGVGFAVIRRRPLVFAAYSAVMSLVLVGVAWTFRTPDGRADLPAFAAGLSLFGFGLLVIRVMLIRSVSLQLLEDSVQRGQIKDDAKLVTKRLDEATRLGLMMNKDGLLRATRLGSVVGSIIGVVERKQSTGPS